MKNRIFLSVVAVVAIIAIALVVLATGGSASSVYRPSQLVAAAQGGSLSRVRVGGRVSQMPIEYKVEPNIELKFFLQDPGTATTSHAPIPVTYSGLKPDMFSAGRDVIIEGEYSGGVLVASKLLTQCPSKYEPPKS